MSVDKLENQEFPLFAGKADNIRKLLLYSVSELLLRQILRSQYQLLLPVCLLDLLEPSGEHDLALINDCNMIAELLDIAHLMTGENNELPVCNQLTHHILQNLGVHRVKSAEGLIQNHNIGICHQRRRKLHLLLITLGQRLELPRLIFRNLKAVQPSFCTRLRRLFIQPAELRQIYHLFDDCTLRIKTSLLRQITDLIFRGHKLLTVNPYLATVCVKNVHQNTDGRRLSRTVPSQKSQCFSALHLKAHAVKHFLLTEALTDLLYLQFHNSSLSAAARQSTSYCSPASTLSPSSSCSVRRFVSAFNNSSPASVIR